MTVRGFVPDRSGDQPPLPGSLHQNRRLAQWITLGIGRTFNVHTGKVEIGQGILTALAAIAADELDVELHRVLIVPATTMAGPDEGVTSGSLSIQNSGIAVRHACAQVRAIALEKLGADLIERSAQPRVLDGVFMSSDGSTLGDYWNLLDAAALDVEIRGDSVPKRPSRYRYVGKGSARRDLPAKAFGEAAFIHDMRMEGMVHARVLRPPSSTAAFIDCDTARVDAQHGVIKTVVDGKFVAVLARTQDDANNAFAVLREATRWQQPDALPDTAKLAEFLRAAPATATVVHSQGDGFARAGTEHRATYFKPYLAHASIGPSCAIARWTGKVLQVWTHSQGIQNLRDDIFLALHARGQITEKAAIEISHVEGAGCYGHNGADDVAFDAALLSLLVPDTPVRVQWSRADELAWSPMGSAQLVELSATLDAAGAIQGWHHELWANGSSSRPGRAAVPTLLAASHIAGGAPIPLSVNAPLAVGGGADRNSIPIYRIPSVEVVNHRLDVMPIRTSALRSLGAYANVFAIESFIDELAHAQGIDAVAMRRAHLDDPRALEILDTALARCAWWNTAKDERGEGIGHGFAMARYKHTGGLCAVAARIEAGAQVRVLDLDIAVDVGQVIDPDGVKNQVEGGAIQSVSWTLKEAVGFDRTRVTSDSWSTYPILRFSEVPRVNVHLIARQASEPLGAGELAQGPVAAAIANAVFDALGVRVRSLPLTPETILQAMNAE